MQWIASKLDRDRKRVLRRTWVRAETRSKAERIAVAVLGRGVVVSEYDASRDPAFAGYVRRVESV